MLFSEIYGSYFNVVAAVLSEASDGKLTDRRMTELVREKAFAESALAIPAALKSGTWPLLDQEYHSILHHKPTMPLTMLQKRWLKALLSDPRIALFDPDTTGLEDVDPLYAQDTFILFDQYADGDPYGDPAYIACFQTALKAIRKKRKLRIRFRGHTGARHSIECIPYRLNIPPRTISSGYWQPASDGSTRSIWLVCVHASCWMPMIPNPSRCLRKIPKSL